MKKARKRRKMTKAERVRYARGRAALARGRKGWFRFTVYGERESKKEAEQFVEKIALQLLPGDRVEAPGSGFFYQRTRKAHP
jgi:hypothetical protein